MLLPYSKLPDTGSLIPSISTGGEKDIATIYVHTDTASTGYIITPKNPI
jgi:hypothetical protein